jgi:hypothetical protein
LLIITTSMTIAISLIPTGSDAFTIHIITIRFGTVHFTLAGMIRFIHGITHTLLSMAGTHGVGIPGTIHGVIVHIATIHGMGVTIAGIHPIIQITIMDTTIIIGTMTIIGAMIMLPATGAQEIPMQFMEGVVLARPLADAPIVQLVKLL